MISDYNDDFDSFDNISINKLKLSVIQIIYILIVNNIILLLPNILRSKWLFSLSRNVLNYSYLNHNSMTPAILIKVQRHRKQFNDTHLRKTKLEHRKFMFCS